MGMMMWECQGHDCGYTNAIEGRSFCIVCGRPRRDDDPTLEADEPPASQEEKAIMETCEEEWDGMDAINRNGWLMEACVEFSLLHEESAWRNLPSDVRGELHAARVNWEGQHNCHRFRLGRAW